MTWLNQPEGTVTEWAVELTYSDGERRYRSDHFDEAEARHEAEQAQFDASYRDEPGVSLPVSARAVSRQVTYSPWEG